MHELSIALSMIEQVEEQMQLNGTEVIEAIYLRIGVLSGVDVKALRFAYQLASEGTELARARLEIELVPLCVYCPQCKSTYTPDPQHILCSRCLTAEPEILAGRELEIRALEIAA